MSSLSSMMTESDMTSPTSTTSSTTDYSAVSLKKSDKTSYRKSSKPMMERKRRARINNCLTQLKSLVLQAMKKDNSQYSKLEKADILELTVKHLKHVQRLPAPNTNQIPEAINKYRAGFNECANEVIRYLGETQGVNNEARTRILSHLSNILTPVNSLPLQQANHAHILPAPTTQSQHHHPHQLQSLQQQHKPHPLLQQQLQNELFQQNQQNISGFPGQQSESASSSLVPDYNNNTSGISNNINRNHVISTTIGNGKDFNIAALPSTTSHINNRGVTQTDIKQIASDVRPAAFQAMNVSSGVVTPSVHLPRTATTPAAIATTPAAMATTPFQLVHSTLPNGQVALVLAPQTVPTMNVFHSPSNLIPQDIAVSILEKQHKEQSLKQSFRQEQSQKNRIISPVPQDLTTTDNNITDKQSKTNRSETETKFDPRLQQPSAFRHPGSINSSNSSSPPLSTYSISSSTSRTSSASVIKKAKTSMSNASNSSTITAHQHIICDVRSNSPEDKKGHIVLDSSPPKNGGVRCPEDVTSVRDLFEYKMGKRRGQSSNLSKNSKSTWRPW